MSILYFLYINVLYINVKEKKQKKSLGRQLRLSMFNILIWQFMLVEKQDFRYNLCITSRDFFKCYQPNFDVTMSLCLANRQQRTIFFLGRSRLMSTQKSKHEQTKIKNNREGRFRYALLYLHLRAVIMPLLLHVYYAKQKSD